MPFIKINDELCKGCSLCVNSCPKNLIKISDKKINSKGYYVAEFIEDSGCTGCTSCALTCPDIAITVER